MLSDTEVVFHDRIDADWSTDFMILHRYSEVLVLHQRKSVSRSLERHGYMDTVECPWNSCLFSETV